MEDSSLVYRCCLMKEGGAAGSPFPRSWRRMSGDRGLGNPWHPLSTPPGPEGRISWPPWPWGLARQLSHPVTDSSFLPQQLPSPPLPLASLQHNGLAALRFHDTLTAGLLCFHSFKHTDPQHFHTIWTPQCPQPLMALTASQARGSHTQKCFLQTGARPWEGGLEASSWGWVGWRGGHSCLLESFSLATGPGPDSKWSMA